MAAGDNTVGITEGSGKNVDTYETTAGYQRQRVIISGKGTSDDVLPVAHDAVDGGSPLKIGGKANQSAPTAVADADRVNAWLDREGAVHVVQSMEPARTWVPGAGRLAISRLYGSYTSVGSPGTQIIGATASTYTYVVGFMVSSASVAGVLITFSDGSGGTSLCGWYHGVQYTPTIVPPSWGQILFRTSANTALYYNQSGVAANAQVLVYYFQSTVAI